MKTIYEFLINTNKTNKKTYTPKTTSELNKILIELCENAPKDEILDLNCVDVSNLDNLSEVFSNLAIDTDFYDTCNFDVSTWDVSNVKNMDYMFENCEGFNCDISKWNVSKCTHMIGMFKNCKKFNQDLSNWNIDNVLDMRAMFSGCLNFDYDLSKWNVKHKVKKYGIFKGTKFNLDPPYWMNEF